MQQVQLDNISRARLTATQVRTSKEHYIPKRNNNSKENLKGGKTYSGQSKSAMAP